ncbi:Uncharacterised protein [uncultured archaeon]|nr:Uncharacterised protein [uncultured archaeon]
MKNKPKIKSREIARYAFAIFVILLGLYLDYLDISDQFLGFSSVGSWLTYIGFVMIAVVTLQLFYTQKRVVDERMIFVANKAMRITFLALVVFAFLIIVLDGIKATTITIPYHLFMSYLICGLIIVYFISYKILLRFY